MSERRAQSWRNGDFWHCATNRWHGENGDLRHGVTNRWHGENGDRMA
jgi:hypothetical protein